MCGVFGYIGSPKDDIFEYLVEGLARLEYRGYDSAGIAVVKEDGEIFLAKKKGEIKRLRERIKDTKITSGLGIGHTRWATHGGVTDKNAHPHADCSNKVVVVHNGIIENFQNLKSKLERSGHRFISETDTEVFAHLVEQEIQKVSGKDRKGSKRPVTKTSLEQKQFVEAVRRSFNMLEGLNAVVVLLKHSEMIIAFRKGSPLVAGKGEDGNFISSDIPTLIEETNRIVFLQEGEGVVLEKDSVRIVNSKNGRMRNSKAKTVKMENYEEDKGNFDHYLLKEIYEQPEVVARIANYDDEELQAAADLIKNAWGTYFTACGTAAHAGLAATYMFSEIARRHVNFAVGSEFPYLEEFLVKSSLLIAASQSGETMDTLEAVRAAKKHKSKVLALVNVPGSSLTRLADKTLLLKAGPEKSVLSTKAYIAKLSMFLLLAYALNGGVEQGKKLLKDTSKQLSGLLDGDLGKKIKNLADKLSSHEHIYIIGRGFSYPTALEGALKIKESSYIHAEGFAGGELKHGVIALIEKGTPCIAVVANDEAKDSILSNAMELSSRGGYIIGIGPDDNDVFDRWIPVPDVGNASVITGIVPLQLLAYHLTLNKGLDPDKPRNLAKSVTVK